MENTAYIEALKKFPCPDDDCGAVGYLRPEKMKIVATLNGQEVVAEGNGTACDACDKKFMDAELTEEVANQVNRIKHGAAHQYLELDRDNGAFIPHAIN